MRKRTDASDGDFPKETHIPRWDGTVRIVISKVGGRRSSRGSDVRRRRVGGGRHDEGGVKVEGGGGELVELAGSQVMRNDGQLGEEKSNVQLWI